MNETRTRRTDTAAQLKALRAEASRYRTVRSSWLLANLNRILSDAAGCTANDEAVSYGDPIDAPVRKPVTLLRYLAAGEGLAAHADLAALDAHKYFAPGVGKLVRREGGLSLDYAREAAQQAGYLAADADINDLLNAINEELHGRPVYSALDQHIVAGADCPF